MSINELLIILFFVVNLGVFIAKIYNIMNLGNTYDLKLGLILLIVSLISNILILSGSMALISLTPVLPSNPSGNITYTVEVPQNQSLTTSILSKFSGFFTTVVVVLTIIETLYSMANISSKSYRIRRTPSNTK